LVNKWKVIVSLAGICIVACSASNSHARAQTPSPWQTVRSSQPLPSPTLWPAYKALDYKTAHPPLSSREERHVRYVLGRVKPCQRDIVYYVYPSDGDANETLVVFFKGASNSSPHVLGDGDEYYDQEDGNVHAFPEDRPASLEADIRNQSCKPAIVATAKPLPTRSPFPSLWPSFEATDYRSARPPLSAGQKAQLLRSSPKCGPVNVRSCATPLQTMPTTLVGSFCSFNRLTMIGRTFSNSKISTTKKMQARRLRRIDSAGRPILASRPTCAVTHVPASRARLARPFWVQTKTLHDERRNDGYGHQDRASRRSVGGATLCDRCGGADRPARSVCRHVADARDVRRNAL